MRTEDFYEQDTDKCERLNDLMYAYKIYRQNDFKLSNWSDKQLAKRNLRIEDDNYWSSVKTVYKLVICPDSTYKGTFVWKPIGTISESGKYELNIEN